MATKRSKQAQLDVIKRDGRCMVCGRIDDTLIGHHISSFGASGDDSPQNMITLCFTCHDNAGHGFIDWSAVNLPIRKYVPEPKGFVMGAMSKDKTGPKVWNADDIFKEILKGQYGYEY